MSCEKKQRGNPHSLTVCQHSFPAASIVRFAGADGRVEVYLIHQKKQVRLKPEDQLFCGKRVWDQRAESGYMKEIEDNYQQLARAVFSGSKKTIVKDEQLTITDMFAIWNIREHIKANPIEDQRIEGDLGNSINYSKDDQEKLEKNNISVIRPDLSIPGRQVAGVNIQLSLFQFRKQMWDAQWGILRASRGQFIVPDNFSNARILPLSPTICFFSQCDDGLIGEDKVRKINQMALSCCREYFFCNDMAKCIR